MTGVPLAERPAEVQVFTDASLEGWGGHVNFQVAQGKWTLQERQWHINVLEMLAVQRVLEHFLPIVRGKMVLIATDNITVVYYIKRQGGTRSPEQ